MSSLPTVTTNTPLTDDIFTALLSNSPSIGSLSLVESSASTAALAALLVHCPNLSSLSLPPAPCNLLYSALHGRVIEYLDQRDILINYAPVNRCYKENADLHYKERKKDMLIASRQVKSFFAGPVKFPSLTHLTVSGSDLVPFERPIEHGKINRLTFIQDDNWRDLTSNKILMLLEKIPNLSGLTINELDGAVLFSPVDGARLSDAARENLKILEDLDLTNTSVHSQGLIEIVQCSTSFRSVNLYSQPHLSNALFRELVRSPKLANLDLSEVSSRSEVLDYKILAECHCLKSFTPGPGITEEALIEIIKANRGLISLNLDFLYLRNVVTDKVLQAIAEYLPDLEELKLVCSSKVTHSGFSPLMHNCRSLRSLTLSEIQENLLIGWEKLKKWKALTALTIHYSRLPNEFLVALSSMTELTTLDIDKVHGPLRQFLPRISALIHLKSLSTLAIYSLSDNKVKGLCNHCIKLDDLILNQSNGLTAASLNFLRSLHTEGSTKLRQFDCRLALESSMRSVVNED